MFNRWSIDRQRPSPALDQRGWLPNPVKQLSIAGGAAAADLPAALRPKVAVADRRYDTSKGGDRHRRDI